MHAEAREDSCFIGCTARRLYRGTILSNLCKIPKQTVLHLRMTLTMENQTRLESWNNYCDDFVNHLRNSKAVLVLLGAGLSASSGISTYQGSGSTWQGHLVRDLATKSRFERDPVLVWEYYRHRQAEILSAVPNAGHFALAGLATMKPDFLTITQNVDGELCRDYKTNVHSILKANGFNQKIFHNELVIPQNCWCQSMARR